MKYIVDTNEWSIAPVDGESTPATWFGDAGFDLLSQWWLQASWQRQYSYQFEWLGRPIIQLPADVMMMQDLIWRVRPTLIVETGIAHGGSVVLHASLLALLHGMNATRPRVVAVDIDIRSHNRHALDAHELRDHWHLIPGSSIDPKVVAQIRDCIQPEDRVMVALDSDHSHEHVSAELALYAPLVSTGSVIVVMDTIMPELAALPNGEAKWRTDHPANSIEAFLKSDIGSEFAVDHSYDRLKLTHSPGGVLQRVPSHEVVDE